jgi:hypothetical protein
LSNKFRSLKEKYLESDERYHQFKDVEWEKKQQRGKVKTIVIDNGLKRGLLFAIGWPIVWEVLLNLRGKQTEIDWGTVMSEWEIGIILIPLVFMVIGYVEWTLDRVRFHNRKK